MCQFVGERATSVGGLRTELPVPEKDVRSNGKRVGIEFTAQSGGGCIGMYPYPAQVCSEKLLHVTLDAIVERLSARLARLDLGNHRWLGKSDQAAGFTGLTLHCAARNRTLDIRVSLLTLEPLHHALPHRRTHGSHRQGHGRW